MWLIVGLGNPGRRYAKTRHNAGCMAADEIACRYGLEFRDREAFSIAKGSLEGNAVILLEPLTFMNRSGLAVRDAMKRYAIPPEKLIVIQDDIDMETGKLKIRKRGSSGGHKGLQSIIENIGTTEFLRVKIGVGREEGVPVEEYVLGKFRKDEAPLIKDALSKTADAVEAIIKDGVEKAMNRFN